MVRGKVHWGLFAWCRAMSSCLNMYSPASPLGTVMVALRVSKMASPAQIPAFSVPDMRPCSKILTGVEVSDVGGLVEWVFILTPDFA